MTIVLVSPSTDWTYNTLKANVADWLHRTDAGLINRVADFIKLGEIDLFRLINMQAIDKEIALTLSSGSRSVDLPNYCAEIRGLFLDSNQPREKIIQYSEVNVPVNTDLSGAPSYFSIAENKLKFDCLADQDYSLALLYTENQSISESNQKNEILTKYPDAYLYAALLQAAPYIVDDKRIGIWQTYYNKAIQDINNKEHANQKNANLRTELPILGSTFNIYRGY